MTGFVATYSIDAFTDVDKFKANMDSFLQYLADTPPAPGHDRVYYAGLPEYEEEQVGRAGGIPFHKEVIEWFDSISSELEITALETV